MKCTRVVLQGSAGVSCTGRSFRLGSPINNLRRAQDSERFYIKKKKIVDQKCRRITDIIKTAIKKSIILSSNTREYNVGWKFFFYTVGGGGEKLGLKLISEQKKSGIFIPWKWFSFRATLDLLLDIVGNFFEILIKRTRSYNHRPLLVSASPPRSVIFAGYCSRIGCFPLIADRSATGTAGSPPPSRKTPDSARSVDERLIEDFPTS